MNVIAQSVPASIVVSTGKTRVPVGCVQMPLVSGEILPQIEISMSVELGVAEPVRPLIVTVAGFEPAIRS